ncbi:MAG: cell division protein FtsZ [Rhodospirillales bacterium]|nr:cell division protein FtsZ [Rhodospirillales bacterium]
MSINLSVPIAHHTPELRPRISVIGCGGAGGNAVNNMIRAHLEGVEFIVANTDAQSLAQSSCERRIQLGVTVTQGLGAGSRPDIGRIAAEEALEDIIQEIRGSNMVFIAAGMGGGTGTGAAPVIARAAREQGILTVGVVTKPFHFEGQHRMRIADQGIEELEQFVDTLIIIPNQNLFRIANERTTFADAFKMADDVLYSGVRGVTDLMVMPGLINLDFADIRAVMSEMGKAMMGTGEATGDRRALDAAEAAISNPLLDDVSMKGARGVLINITGSLDMTLFEVDEAANRIRSEVDPDAFIIFGSTFDDTLEGRIRCRWWQRAWTSRPARPSRCRQRQRRRGRPQPQRGPADARGADPRRHCRRDARVGAGGRSARLGSRPSRSPRRPRGGRGRRARAGVLCRRRWRGPADGGWRVRAASDARPRRRSVRRRRRDPRRWPEWRPCGSRNAARRHGQSVCPGDRRLAVAAEQAGADRDRGAGTTARRCRRRGAVAIVAEHGRRRPAGHSGLPAPSGQLTAANNRRASQGERVPKPHGTRSPSLAFTRLTYLGGRSGRRGFCLMRPGVCHTGSCRLICRTNNDRRAPPAHQRRRGVPANSGDARV